MLATRMGGQLATFDTGIPVKAVRGATRQTLAVLTTQWWALAVARDLTRIM